MSVRLLGQRPEVEDLSAGLARHDEHGDVERGVQRAARGGRGLRRHHAARARRLLPERGRRVVCGARRRYSNHSTLTVSLSFYIRKLLVIY